MSGAEHIGWAVIELMGHRRMAGYVSERDVAGQPFLQIDVPAEDGSTATQLYSAGAVYCITPTTEDVAKAVAFKSQPTPVHRWELPAARGSEDGFGDLDQDDDGFDPHEDDPPLAHEAPDDRID